MSKAGCAGYCISVGYSRFDPANSGQKCCRNNQRKGDCKAEDRSLYLWLFGSVEVVHNKTLPTPKVTRHKFDGSVYPLVPVGPLKSLQIRGSNHRVVPWLAVLHFPFLPNFYTKEIFYASSRPAH